MNKQEIFDPAYTKSGSCSSSSIRMTAMELIRAAQRRKNPNIDIKLPLGDGEFLECVLAPVNFEDMVREQTIIKAQEYKRFCEAGLDKIKPNLDKWEADIRKRTSDKEAIKLQMQNMPANQAEVEAQNMSALITARLIIPKYLKTTDGVPLFQNKDELEEFQDYVARDFSWRKVLLDAFTKILRVDKEIEETAKN